MTTHEHEITETVDLCTPHGLRCFAEEAGRRW
jgi:hypothetical protein